MGSTDENQNNQNGESRQGGSSLKSCIASSSNDDDVCDSCLPKEDRQNRKKTMIDYCLFRLWSV